MPEIHLAFVDDWEVRGNGSGDPRVLQFEPMRRLIAIFNRFGIRGSFNVEVMQQLGFREWQDRFPELRELADEWETAVVECYGQGHDVQLHIHPQWVGAEYLDGQWRLASDWSLLNYPAEQIRQLLQKGKEFLESLLRTVNPNYRCISYRAGSWCIAPSPFTMSILSELGFVFDTSIVGGLHDDTKHVKLDYRWCEESFLPFYPDMADARRVSGQEQPIVCVPTNHFLATPSQALRRDAGQASRALRQKVRTLMRGRNPSASAGGRGSSAGEWTNKHESGAVGKIRMYLKRYTTATTYVSSISKLNYAMLQAMLANVRREAAKRELRQVPIILASHTKDIRDFADIEKFVGDVANAPDVKCVTLTEIANGLRDGTYPIRKAA